ncbi:MAG: alkaline phosphatase D family protein, partial [Actinomycetota bacterium]|nr:alkaline phosphatase D family protein [Actinomycetota bacterium]
MTAFRHGVASADPLPDGVLLWTRCTTDTRESVAVDWWASPTPHASDAVAAGTAEACPAGDFTVHVDVGGLEPATTYWYGFRVGAETSPVGRTRTAPAPGRPLDHLRVGLTACANWPCGFFNAYANLAARELDLVVHVGDYIYENDRVSGSRRAVRAHRPRGVAVTLEDYRTRYAQYRTDPDLQALHARHPVVAVWDDHEIAGGAWRDGAHAHRRRHGPWEDRRAAAVQAYVEWIPVRHRAPGTVHRAVGLGPLADLVMLDTRLAGRDRPPASTSGPAARVIDRDAALLGEEQWRWLEGEIGGSRARWLLVGNQVMMAPLHALNVAGGMGVNPTQWDGYPVERERFYDTMRRAGRTSNVAVLTGDLHSSWAADLPVGAEFVTPSVTTDSFARTVLPSFPGASRLARRVFLAQNRHLRMADLDRHGYVVLEVTPERLQADFWHVDTIARRHPG